jgi:hypothetical protein
MPMERGVRNMAVQAGLIAVSTHSSNVKPRFRETAGFATAIHSQAMVSSHEGNILSRKGVIAVAIEYAWVVCANATTE